MTAKRRHIGPLVFACVIALVTAFFLLPHGYQVSPKLVFFAPFYSGIIATHFASVFLGWVHLELKVVSVSFGIVIAVIGWYFPFAILSIDDPPMSKLGRISFMIGFAIIWSLPTIMTIIAY